MFSTKIATQYIYNSVRLQNSYIFWERDLEKQGISNHKKLVWRVYKRQ